MHKVIFKNIILIHFSWQRDVLTDLENVQLIFFACAVAE